MMFSGLPSAPFIVLNSSKLGVTPKMLIERVTIGLAFVNAYG